MTTIKKYTEEQIDMLLEKWPTWSPEKKKEHAKFMGRSVSNINSMLTYHRKKRGLPMAKRGPKKNKKKKDKVKSSNIEVTSIIKNENVLKPAIIHVQGLDIEIPASSFFINGVKIEW